MSSDNAGLRSGSRRGGGENAISALPAEASGRGPRLRVQARPGPGPGRGRDGGEFALTGLVGEPPGSCKEFVVWQGKGCGPDPSESDQQVPGDA